MWGRAMPPRMSGGLLVCALQAAPVDVLGCGEWTKPEDEVVMYLVMERAVGVW